MPSKFLIFAIGLTLTGAALAADFTLDLPKASNQFILKSACGGSTYYNFMHESLAPKIKELAPEANKKPNVKALSDGDGVGVKLDDHNWNFHVNFPNAAQGGRSYGWTDNMVGDWSDAMYLDNLEKIVGGSDKEVATFYTAVIQLVGKCEPADLSDLEKPTQRVATNFLAIFSAEEYRAIVGTPNWDDAIFEVTLLGSFHGGQKKLTKFYHGDFKAQAVDQFKCAYSTDALRTKSPLRDAKLDDYWQYGRSAKIDAKSGQCKGDSGINLTRPDFTAMGKAITKYESSIAKNSSLGGIQAVVGSSDNVISDISRYFTSGKADVTKIDKLAAMVAQFMVDVRKDSEEITSWEAGGEK